MPTWETELQSSQAKELADISTNEVSFFMMEGKCYLLDGVNFLVYDGTTVNPVTPYIPTIQLSKSPAGGGSANEDYNLLGNKFKDSFSGDGTATVYQLSLSGLDSTTVTALVGTTTLTEGTGLTVDRSNGKVTFTTAPVKGTNNVIITAGKTVSGYPERIKNCSMSIGYGGSNDSRIFISGNPNLEEYVFKCGLYDPGYWPENGFYKFTEKVMGFSKQYDYLIIERVNGKHQISFQITTEGVVSFPSKPINDKVGTIASKSIQIIENNPVSLSRDGVYMITASNVRDERNVTHISEAIDRLLLNEVDLSKSVSIDYDKKYWLALNGKVYVLDYTQKSLSNPYGEWFVYDNIYASCFLVMDGILYFGSSQTGNIYRFLPGRYNDDGQPISAYWKSKLFTFGVEERYKYVDSLFFGLKPSGKTSVNLSYVTDKKENTIIGKPVTFNLFDFNTLDFESFTFYFSSVPKEFKQKIKAKKITHFQVMLQNKELDESLDVLSLSLSYRYQSRVR